MAHYAVESSRQPMTVTGIVDKVVEWEETPDGRRRPSERHARNEETGMPLWAVEVIYVQTSFGRKSTVTAKVIVGAAEEPKPAPLTAIEFTGLSVEARVNKAGGFSENWSAEALADAKPAAKPSGESASASSSSSGRSAA